MPVRAIFFGKNLRNPILEARGARPPRTPGYDKLAGREKKGHFFHLLGVSMKHTRIASLLFILALQGPNDPGGSFRALVAVLGAKGLSKTPNLAKNGIFMPILMHNCPIWQNSDKSAKFSFF